MNCRSDALFLRRDLKPENILLDGKGNVKIADFGLAATNMIGNKKVTEYCGTSGYMAPEVSKKKKPRETFSMAFSSLS